MKFNNDNFFKIIDILGTPDILKGKAAIYRMDCLKGLKKIDTEIFNLTVTSPPYNIGKEYENIISLDDYILWVIEWAHKIYDCSLNNASFWLNVGYIEIANKGKAVPIPYLLWDKLKFYFQQEIVWNYSAGVSCKKMLSPRNEKLLWFLKDKGNYIFNLDEIRDPNVKYPNQKKNGVLRCNPLGKNPSDVWQIKKVTSGEKRSSKERTAHPAQFPEALIDRIIKASSNENDLILDPFMGSGTVAKVANDNNRFSIGFEINEDYMNIIEERLATSL